MESLVMLGTQIEQVRSMSHSPSIGCVCKFFVIFMLIVIAISPNTNEIYIYDVRTKERKWTLTEVCLMCPPLSATFDVLYCLDYYVLILTA
jgi:hypothetical protein